MISVIDDYITVIVNVIKESCFFIVKLHSGVGILRSTGQTNAHHPQQRQYMKPQQEIIENQYNEPQEESYEEEYSYIEPEIDELTLEEIN